MARRRTGLVWFKVTDLRIADHEPLLRAHKACDFVAHVFCFDPRWFDVKAGIAKTGPHRARFMRESVAALRDRLGQHGTRLLVCHERPEVAIPRLASQLCATDIFSHEEVCSEELLVEVGVGKGLPASLQHHHFWGNTLYHIDDLVHDPRAGEVPGVFSHFRKQTERSCRIRAPLPLPASWKPTPPGPPDAGPIPSAEQLGVRPCLPAVGPSLAEPLMQFKGGEAAAEERLRQYIWSGDHLKQYKQTRNGLLRPNDSSKLSPWLAFGCVSARTVADHVRRYEAERVANASTYWLLFELLWRDFFRFSALQWGNALFHLNGPRGVAKAGAAWGRNPRLVRAWVGGQTGYPLVDACMRELRATGFMSNRGRQIAASFFVNDLRLDWRIGAAWMESMLIDHDPASNYGNWQYVAGVGADPREQRYFSIPKQGKTYDPAAAFCKHWVPELAQLEASDLLDPRRLEAHVRRAARYPAAVVALAGDRRRGGRGQGGASAAAAGGGGRVRRRRQRQSRDS